MIKLKGKNVIENEKKENKKPVMQKRKDWNPRNVEVRPTECQKH